MTGATAPPSGGAVEPSLSGTGMNATVAGIAPFPAVSMAVSRSL